MIPYIFYLYILDKYHLHLYLFPGYYVMMIEGFK